MYHLWCKYAVLLQNTPTSYDQTTIRSVFWFIQRLCCPLRPFVRMDAALLFSCVSKLYCFILIFNWMVSNSGSFIKISPILVVTIHRHVLQPLPPKIVCAPTWSDMRAKSPATSVARCWVRPTSPATWRHTARRASAALPALTKVGAPVHSSVLAPGSFDTSRPNLLVKSCTPTSWVPKKSQAPSVQGFLCWPFFPNLTSLQKRTQVTTTYIWYW